MTHRQLGWSVTTTTFGKRGLTSAPVSSVPVKAAAAAPALREAHEERVLDQVPILTIGLILFLFGVFALERRFAFDIGKNGVLSVESLIAFGGALSSSISAIAT